MTASFLVKVNASVRNYLVFVAFYVVHEVELFFLRQKPVSEDSTILHVHDILIHSLENDMHMRKFRVLAAP